MSRLPKSARANPQAQFLIKPKNVERWWIEKIEQAVEQGLGVPLSAIPNCRIVADQAPDLIRRSVAAIGLNSTVVLETAALDRDLIMPVFAEAAGKYADKVYFPHFRDVFSVASSRAELSEMLTRVSARRAPQDAGAGPSECHASMNMSAITTDIRLNVWLRFFMMSCVAVNRCSLKRCRWPLKMQPAVSPHKQYAGADRVSLRRFSRNRRRPCRPLRSFGR